jgi:hypothetical protein
MLSVYLQGQIAGGYSALPAALTSVAGRTVRLKIRMKGRRPLLSAFPVGAKDGE